MAAEKKSLTLMVCASLIAGCASADKSTLVAAFTEVGELSDGVESDLIGSSAFQTLDNGDIIVLDRANGRLIRREPDGDETFYSFTQVFGDNVSDVTDFLIVRGAIYGVTADGVVFAQAPEGLSQTGPVALEASDAEDAVLELQRSGRSLRPAGASIALEANVQEICQSDDWASLSAKPWSDSRRAPDGERLTALFRRETETRLEVRVSRGGDVPIPAEPVIGAASIATGSLVGVDEDKRVYLLVEFIDQSRSSLAVSASVFRLALAAEDARYVIESRFDIPIASYQSLPTRYVEVKNGDVRVFGRKIGERRQSIVQLEPAQLANTAQIRRLGGGQSETPAAQRTVQEIGELPGAVRLESSGSPTTTREEIVARASEFDQMSWTLSEVEYGPPAKMASLCAPDSGAAWTRPGRLNGKLTQTIKGMPYRWGGWDTVEDFLADATRVAGDTCTCRSADCVVAGTKGADCSGFITNAWAVPTRSKLGTVTIPNWSTAKNWKELKCGDVLNKSGNHVRLFLRYVPDYGGSIEFYESSIDCGGVCRRFAPAALFQGYVPLEYRNLTVAAE